MPWYPFPSPTPHNEAPQCLSGARLRKRGWGQGRACSEYQVLGLDELHASSRSLAHSQPGPPLPSAHGHAVL